MAGVSVATVSNVINKTKQVTPKVKEKVEMAIKELHTILRCSQEHSQ
ncbi:MAG: LacI family DNA-binding transcriptional regulator [Lachnospiraceae bacterium]|nr:LacI family DNA-binding transcriptional regulator [Lachnospiraceae bacterium]